MKALLDVPDWIDSDFQRLCEHKAAFDSLAVGMLGRDHLGLFRALLYFCVDETLQHAADVMHKCALRTF